MYFQEVGNYYLFFPHNELNFNQSDSLICFHLHYCRVHLNSPHYQNCFNPVHLIDKKAYFHLNYRNNRYRFLGLCFIGLRFWIKFENLIIADSRLGLQSNFGCFKYFHSDNWSFIRFGKITHRCKYESFYCFVFFSFDYFSLNFNFHQILQFYTLYNHHMYLLFRQYFL